MLSGIAREEQQTSEEAHDVAHCHCVGTPCKRIRQAIRDARRDRATLTKLAEDNDLTIGQVLTILARKT